MDAYSKQRQADAFAAATREDVKRDAATGRNIKKWGHRAEGALVGGGAGFAAGKLGHLLLKKKVKLSAIYPGMSDARYTIQFGPAADLIQASLRAQKRHAMAWKSMTPKQRMMAEKELREHRKAINEQEDHMHNTSSGSNDSWRNGMNMSDQRAINAFSETPRALKLLSERFPSSYFNQESVENTCPGWSANTRDYRPGSTTTHFAAKNEPEQDPTMPEDVGIYGEEQHPEDTLTIEQLRKKMMNVGQTKPQLPLREQPAIKKLPMDKAFHTFGRKIFFDGDQNGRVHSQSGQFVPAVDGQSPQAVQNAYNPLKRKTGVSPFKNKLAKAALRRV